MADNSQENKQIPDDFKDPLGVKDPLSAGLDSPSDGTDYEVLTPSKEIDIDAAIAEVKQEMESLRLAEELEDDTKDLFVIVDNPEKHGGAMGTYITFRITTKTTRSVFDNSEYQVRRRYNDFVWLRQRLEETQPAHLVPPLPEKHSMNMDRYNPDFVKKRMAGLAKFLQRIADHPVLSFNNYYKTFLTATQSEFQAAKKEGSGLITRVADSFHNMSAAYMMKNRPQEFTVMQEYVQVFGEKLSVLERISDRIWKEQYAYLNDLNEWGPIFTLWSNSEDKLKNALVAMAISVEKCFVALQDLYDSTEAEFHQPLREYLLYAEAIKAVLRRRDGIQMEYDMIMEELNRKKDERDQEYKHCIQGSKAEPSVSLDAWMGKNPDEVKHQKLLKLEERVEKLSRKVEELNDRAVCADTDLKADMERWHKTKKRDFKQVFMAMADRQIKYYERCLAAWEEAIPQIQRSEQHSLDADTLPLTDSDPAE